uniref:Ovule protein n=1 Tax=Strongyloides venezuelensis TaxID=75913 RepID=A0A0K0FIC0_STRVS
MKPVLCEEYFPRDLSFISVTLKYDFIFIPFITHSFLDTIHLLVIINIVNTSLFMCITKLTGLSSNTHLLKHQ